MPERRPIVVVDDVGHILTETRKPLPGERDGQVSPEPKSVAVCDSFLPDGSRNPRWLDERRKGVTATEVARLMSGGSWMDLWARKTGKVERSAADSDERAWWGIKLEGVVLEAYSSDRYAGRPVKPSGTLVQAAEHPHLMATLDARTEHPEHGWVPLDAKTTDKFLEWKWDEGPPEQYLWQIRTQAVVEAAPMSSIACLLGGNRLIWADDILTDVDRDRILAVAERFVWYMRHNTPPQEMDPHTETKRALDRTYNPISGTRIDLPALFTDLDREYEELARSLKESDVLNKPLRERKAEIENIIRRAMENHSDAVTMDGAHWTLKRVERKGHVVKPSSYNKLTRKKKKV